LRSRGAARSNQALQLWLTEAATAQTIDFTIADTKASTEALVVTGRSAARDGGPEAMTPEERLARLEAEMEDVRSDLIEIKADVKALLAQLNNAKGRASMAAIVLMAGGGILTWIGDHVVVPLLGKHP
jgi:hypothetical protein